MICSLILFFSAGSVQAQADKKENKPVEDKCNQELIIGVPKVSEKNLFLLTETASKTSGMKYIDFCENDKLLLIKYDQEIYPRPDDVIKAFREQHIIMPMLVKEGRFEDVKEMCEKK